MLASKKSKANPTVAIDLLMGISDFSVTVIKNTMQSNL